ncbi:MAG: thymidine phosphorylase [Clostridia bacterium]|nr:thymidine phosphorylase [Clostridia bacterium]
MDIKSIIAKKRNRKELTKDEIKVFVGKYTKGEISDAQAAALLSYIYTNGLTEREIVDFTLEMASSGDMIDLSQISDNIVDKHSTGGVGDKATLILMPIIASLGLPVAKISSRGFGISGGTIDKLESIPGYDSEISLEEFKQNVEKVGVSIIHQSFNLAPAESKIYKLRNEIGCGDSLPIIAASLMSLKVASGSNKIVFDITCGNGTYIKTREEAKRLARLLKRLGVLLGKDVGSVITSMDEPLGYSVGHILEIKETLECLQGRMSQDVGDVVVSLGRVILELSTNVKDKVQNERTIIEAIKSGRAYDKFKEMVASQYGSLEYIDNVEKFPVAKNVIPVYSTEDGFVERIDADIVGSIARYLGAGRMNKDSEINRTAGIELKKKIGDEVKTGDILAYIHTDDDTKVMGATQNLKDAFKLTTKKVIVKSKVLDII